MKPFTVISGAVNALVLAALPANAEIDRIPLDISNNEKSKYNLVQNYNSNLKSSTSTKINYSEKYAYSHNKVSHTHNAVSPYCTDISIQNSCYQYPDHSSLTPTEAGHLEAFNFARSYIPYLTNGKIDYLRNNFISGLISKATTNLTKETSKFLEVISFCFKCFSRFRRKLQIPIQHMGFRQYTTYLVLHLMTLQNLKEHYFWTNKSIGNNV